jgi:hypothetical protein
LALSRVGLHFLLLLALRFFGTTLLFCCSGRRLSLSFRRGLISFMSGNLVSLGFLGSLSSLFSFGCKCGFGLSGS